MVDGEGGEEGEEGQAVLGTPELQKARGGGVDEGRESSGKQEKRTKGCGCVSEREAETQTN